MESFSSLYCAGSAERLENGASGDAVNATTGWGSCLVDRSASCKKKGRHTHLAECAIRLLVQRSQPQGTDMTSAMVAL